MKFNPQYIIFFIIFISLSIIYEKIKVDEDKKNSDYYYNMVDKYLINNNNLGMVKKPMLWIHLHNDDATIPEVNSRSWISFYSRDSKNFNQPYQYLTIKSIIDKCSDDFEIAIIDDRSFNKIIPEWKIDFSKIANPIKSHLRLLAMCIVLNTYGGILVPSSFICFKSLKPLYDSNVNKMFVGDFSNHRSSANIKNLLMPEPVIMGCSPNNNTMIQFIKYLEILNSRDFTAETDFIGKPNIWLNNEILSGNINLINGRLIGNQKECGDIINIEELVGSSFINLHKQAYGLYIPWNELINRVSLGWFVRLSPQQVLESNTVIGKYILINSRI